MPRDTADEITRSPPQGLPPDEREVGASLTPTAATTDPVQADEIAREIESDPALSPVAEQPGAASISNLPNRRERDWKV